MSDSAEKTSEVTSEIGEEVIEILIDDLSEDEISKALRIVEAVLFAAEEPLDVNSITPHLPTGYPIADFLVKLQSDIAARKEQLLRTKVAEEAKAAREAAAQKAKAEASERACAMSEAGSRMLVELVMRFTPRLVNTSDTVDAVWQHIHHAFMQLVTKGDLPETDGRSASALRHR